MEFPIPPPQTACKCLRKLLYRTSSRPSPPRYQSLTIVEEEEEEEEFSSSDEDSIPLTPINSIIEEQEHYLLKKD